MRSFPPERWGIIFNGMPHDRTSQLGFDFFAPVSAPEATPLHAVSPMVLMQVVPMADVPLPVVAPVQPQAPFARLAVQPEPTLLGMEAVPAPMEMEAPPQEPRPARGRTAVRARTAVLFSRLQDLGLRGVDGLVLMRTRTVMVSLIGRTLRVHEGYADAPERVLRAVVAFAIARTKAERQAARDVILAHDVERAPAPRRREPARPGDLPMLAQLAEAHRQLNVQWFAGSLHGIPVRLSSRMATRLGHFDPGSKHTPPEIVLSRTHITRHGWREAMHTLLHEMVHQWQHETGRVVDHGSEFRQKAREVGITPAARRDVTPLERKRRAGTS
ncbi:MAG TPA: SprT-like domain-containing protein [Gemmatimonas sp.]|uniref:SprT-like domain-containing protein n=1 Tax=Gemmatimonas sp. TaxID=1962908 RepID=UPI002ED9A9CA